MSTHAIVTVKDEEATPIMALYIHHDGYPKAPHGAGYRLAKFLGSRRMVAGKVEGETANGMHDLAAQVVAHFKAPACGNVYLFPPGEEAERMAHYVYTVTWSEATRSVRLWCRDACEGHGEAWELPLAHGGTTEAAWTEMAEASLAEVEARVKERVRRGVAQ